MHEIPTGAYNIRKNGESAGRSSTEHIIITNKKDAPGIDITILPNTKNESVHIPVVLTQTGLTDKECKNVFELVGKHWHEVKTKAKQERKEAKALAKAQKRAAKLNKKVTAEEQETTADIPSMAENTREDAMRIPASKWEAEPSPKKAEPKKFANRLIKRKVNKNAEQNAEETAEVEAEQEIEL